MFHHALGWLVKSKITKVGTIGIGSTGVLALLINLVNTKEESLRQYVDSKHSIAIVEISNMKQNVKDIKGAVNRIETYLINKPRNGGK